MNGIYRTAARLLGSQGRGAREDAGSLRSAGAERLYPEGLRNVCARVPDENAGVAPPRGVYLPGGASLGRNAASTARPAT
jgi:hypothetical protein